MIRKRDKEKPTFECIEMDDIKRLHETAEKENSDEDKISLDDLSVCSPSKLHKQSDLTEDEEEEQEKLIHSKLYESMNQTNSNVQKKDTHWFDGVDDSDDGDDPDSDEKGNSPPFVNKFPNLLLIGGDQQGGPDDIHDGGNHNGNYNNNPPGNLPGNSTHMEEQPPPEKYMNCSGESERIEKPSDDTYTGGRNTLCSEMGKDNLPEMKEGGYTQMNQHAGKNELEKWRKYVSSDEEGEKAQTGKTTVNAANQRLEVAEGEDIKERVSNQSDHSDVSESHIGVRPSAIPPTPLNPEVTHRIDPKRNDQCDYAKWGKQANRSLGGSRSGKTRKQYNERVDERGKICAIPLLHSSRQNSDDEDSSPLFQLGPDRWATSRVSTSDRHKGRNSQEEGTNKMTRIISRIEESVEEKKTQKGGKHNRGGGIQGGNEGSDSDHCDDDGHDAWRAEQVDTVTPVSHNNSNPALPPIQVTFTDTQKVNRTTTPKYTLRKYDSGSYSNQVGSPPNDMGVPLSKKSFSSSHVYCQNGKEDEDQCVEMYDRLERPRELHLRGSAPEGKHAERHDPHSDETHRHAYRIGVNSVNAAENVQHGGMSDDLPSRPKANSTAPVNDTPAQQYEPSSPTNVSRVSPSSIHKEMEEEQRPFMDDTHFQVNPIKLNDAKMEKCFHAIKDLCNEPDGKRKNSPNDRRNVSLCSEYLDRPFGTRNCEEGRRWSESPDRRDHQKWRHIDGEDPPIQNVCKSSDVNLYENNFQCLSQVAVEEQLPPDIYQFIYKENELWDKTRGRSNLPRREESDKTMERSGEAVDRQPEGKGDPSSVRTAAGVAVPVGVTAGATAGATTGGEEAPAGTGGKVKRRIIDCKNDRLKWGTTQVIIDIDDTIRSSGGYKFFNYALGGVDAQYQRGETYPGSFQFIFELAMNKLPAEAKPLLLSVLTARIPQVPITEDSFLNKKFNEVAERRGIKSWGIDCDNKILYSTLKEWVWNETRGEKKFVNFKHLHKYVLQQNSLVRYIWIGDTGDMDKQAGEMMIRTYPQRMKAVFLHHVKGKDDNTLLPSDYFIKSVPIFFFRTYIGAATKAHAYNLIDKKGLTRVLVQAVLDLEKSKAPASSSKWEDLIKDIILSDAMDELDKYNAETVNRTKKIIAQRMREISERKLHFIS
ncbi:Uncharacterized protein PCOAH_00030990 [Plasmodium coatneyi]|uniref:Uncharacterized protein n=1 Tax=Plasmodium coatneyi TaxID=208452 RepID=A0A1B1E1T4_9APIC|nr:Uncharacterized protein PCOAH_00030990 [Plasmodium coatneyi]ANQ08799.1 Uncharacterized protein PCOAH_00030990 [Plasmodium coatneyi]